MDSTSTKKPNGKDKGVKKKAVEEFVESLNEQDVYLLALHDLTNEIVEGFKAVLKSTPSPLKDAGPLTKEEALLVIRDFVDVVSAHTTAWELFRNDDLDGSEAPDMLMRLTKGHAKRIHYAFKLFLRMVHEVDDDDDDDDDGGKRQ